MSDLRVLIVDDNVSFLESMRSCFAAKEQVSAVETAADGREALEKLRTGKYDILLPRYAEEGADLTSRIKYRLGGSQCKRVPASSRIAAVFPQTLFHRPQDRAGFWKCCCGVVKIYHKFSPERNRSRICDAVSFQYQERRIEVSFADGDAGRTAALVFFGIEADGSCVYSVFI